MMSYQSTTLSRNNSIATGKTEDLKNGDYGTSYRSLAEIQTSYVEQLPQARLPVIPRHSSEQSRPVYQVNFWGQKQSVIRREALAVTRSLFMDWVGQSKLLRLESIFQLSCTTRYLGSHRILSILLPTA